MMKNWVEKRSHIHQRGYHMIIKDLAIANRKEKPEHVIGSKTLEYVFKQIFYNGGRGRKKIDERDRARLGCLFFFFASP